MEKTAPDFRYFEVLVCFLFVLHIPQCSSHDIMFTLKERSVNEVIFAGDVNLTMFCNTTIATVVNVSIATNSGQIVATNEEHDSYIEYAIHKVSLNHSGIFSCRITYFKEDERTLQTKVKYLSLFVNETGPVCFANGSGVGEPYKKNCVLLLSCYCLLAKGDCFWSSTIVGSKTARTIEPIEHHQHSNKEVLRIKIVPVNNEESIMTRYDCFQGSRSSERCSVSPFVNSSWDSILSSTPTIVSSFQNPTIAKLSESTPTLPNLQVNNYASPSTVSTSHAHQGNTNTSTISNLHINNSATSLEVATPFVHQEKSNTNFTTSAVPSANVTYPPSELILNTRFTEVFVTGSQLNDELKHTNQVSSREPTSALILKIGIRAEESSDFVFHIVLAVGGVISLTVLFIFMLTFLICRQRRRKSGNMVVTQNVVNVDPEPSHNEKVRACSIELSDYFDDDGYRYSFASSIDSMILKKTEDDTGHGSAMQSS